MFTAGTLKTNRNNVIFDWRNLVDLICQFSTSPLFCNFKSSYKLAPMLSTYISILPPNFVAQSAAFLHRHPPKENWWVLSPAPMQCSQLPGEYWFLNGVKVCLTPPFVGLILALVPSAL